MNNPEAEIEGVIRGLTQTSPSQQREVIETYFTTDAAFTHPFCRVDHFSGSRFLIRAIYRWYKIMSPSIDLEIKSIAYDSKNLVLYVSIFQIFRIWFIPFFYAPVNLVSKLHLKRNSWDHKYYISAQDDLYQVNEFVKFFAPLIGSIFVWLWQVFATLNCWLLAIVFWPVSWYEEKYPGIAGSKEEGDPKRPMLRVPTWANGEKGHEYVPRTVNQR